MSLDIGRKVRELNQAKQSINVFGHYSHWLCGPVSHSQPDYEDKWQLIHYDFAHFLESLIVPF
jgi:hypothetical protein